MMCYRIVTRVRHNCSNVYEEITLDIVVDLHKLASEYGQKAYDNKSKRVREAKGALIIEVAE